MLPDFDEGKRSCRRKLERHNNRRKRKPVDKGGVASKQQQVLSQNDNSVIDVDDGKGISWLSLLSCLSCMFFKLPMFDFSWKFKLISLVHVVNLKQIIHVLVTREWNKRLR